MYTANTHRLLSLCRRALIFGLVLTALSTRSSVRADNPVTAPLGLTVEPDAPRVRSLDADDQEAWEWEVIDLVNQERTSQGIPPLKFNADLQTAARVHGQDMGVDNYFDHDSYNYSGGSWTYDQSWSNRVRSYYAGGTFIGENIAAGYGSPASVMNGWMNSPGHRNNILSTNYTEIGVGYYYNAGDSANVYIPSGDPQYGNGPYYHYWVQDFGSRSGVYPVIINDEAYSTTNRTVQLYVYGPSGAEQMRFSNDGGNWSTWETFAANKTWDLATGNTGSRTVHAQVKKGLQTYDASDDIYYVTTDPVLAVDPTAATFLTEQGSGDCVPLAYVIYVFNTGGGTLDWDASKSTDWFNIVTGADTITTTCESSVVGGLGLGTQTGSIAITATGALNSPQTVSVTLVITQNIRSTCFPLVIRNH